MPSKMRDRLTLARRQRFVGRTFERKWFETALSEAELPFQVLYVFGPGGIGKTALVHEFMDISARLHVPAVYLDARNVDPSPEGFLAALGLALELAPEASPLDALGAAPRQLLIIDTYETLEPLDAWLHESCFAQLPENVLIVLASRNPPSSAWRADPGWQTLIRVLPLRNLGPEESRELLTLRKVPETQHAAVLDFTHGHPLALALVADVLAQRADQQFQAENAPDIVKALLERFLQKVPGPAHRAALEACALVRMTTQPLLAELLQMHDLLMGPTGEQGGAGQGALELFEWLRGLSFIESGPYGIFPHDLAREALSADVRWRNPDWYAELHRRARTFYTTRLPHLNGVEQQRDLFDLIYLHRNNPAVKPFFEWQGSGHLYADVMREADRPALVEIVKKHEGAESARLAEQLLGSPEGVWVVREAGHPPAGFMAMVNLANTSSARLDDPGTRAALEYLRKHAPLRPGEVATLFRFWMSAESYQSVSPVQSLIFVLAVRHYLVTPRLAYTFFPCADGAFWNNVLVYADLARVPADFQVDGKTYAVFGHDWRVRPPNAWLAILGERELALHSSEAPPSESAPLVVLSEPDFASAVREALRDYAQPDLLRDNPLLRSRLIVERTGPAATSSDRVAALRSVIKGTAESLRSPRDVKLYRALDHTYLHPAATQEQASELAAVPFSSFRRHLKAGLARVQDLLWRLETEGLER